MFYINKEFNILILESDIEIEKAYSDLCFHNASIFIESEQNSTIQRMITAFKSFINRCAETIKDLYYKLKEKINEVIIQRKLNKLTEFSKMVAIAKKQGKTSFKCIDIDKVVSLLKEESKMYKKEINSFCYKYIHGSITPDKTEQNIQKIEIEMEKYSNQLNELLNSPRVYNINEAEKIVSKLTKDKEYIEVLNNYTKEIKDIEKYTINVMKSIDIYREENGLNDLSGIQACITKSILYLRNHTFEIVNHVITIISFFGVLNKFQSEIPTIDQQQFIDLMETDPEKGKKLGKEMLIATGKNLLIQSAPAIATTAIDQTIIKNKEQERINEISKIYQSPSLKFR